jgi:hypothetical protein
MNPWRWRITREDSCCCQLQVSSSMTYCYTFSTLGKVCLSTSLACTTVYYTSAFRFAPVPNCFYHSFPLHHSRVHGKFLYLSGRYTLSNVCVLINFSFPRSSIFSPLMQRSSVILIFLSIRRTDVGMHGINNQHQ